MFEQITNLFKQIVICLNKLTICLYIIVKMYFFFMSSAGLRSIQRLAAVHSALQQSIAPSAVYKSSEFL